MGLVLVLVLAAAMLLPGCGADEQPLEDAVAGVSWPATWDEQSRVTEADSLLGGCSPVAGADCPRVTVTFDAAEEPEAARDLALAALAARGYPTDDPGGDCRGAFEGQERCRATASGDDLVFVVTTATPDDGEGSAVEVRATYDE